MVFDEQGYFGFLKLVFDLLIYKVIILGVYFQIFLHTSLTHHQYSVPGTFHALCPPHSSLSPFPLRTNLFCTESKSCFCCTLPIYIHWLIGVQVSETIWYLSFIFGLISLSINTSDSSIFFPKRCCLIFF